MAEMLTDSRHAIDVAYWLKHGSGNATQRPNPSHRLQGSDGRAAVKPEAKGIIYCLAARTPGWPVV